MTIRNLRPRDPKRTRILRQRSPTDPTTTLTATPTATYSPNGADRVLVGLKLLTGFPQGVSLEEFARELRAPKSTAHRVLATLRRAGLAQQDGTGRYHLALEYVRLALEFYEQLDVRDIVEPTLRALADRFGEAAYYASLDGPDIVYLARAAAAGRVQTARTVGERQPAHSTATGKALLAHSLTDQAEVRAYVARYGPLPRLTAMTLVTVGELQHDLDETRQRGYAVDREENEIGVACLAVPVFLDLPTHPTGGISLAAISQRTSVDELMAAANEVVAIIRDHLGSETIRSIKS